MLSWLLSNASLKKRKRKKKLLNTSKKKLTSKLKSLLNKSKNEFIQAHQRREGKGDPKIERFARKGIG